MRPALKFSQSCDVEQSLHDVRVVERPARTVHITVVFDEARDVNVCASRLGVGKIVTVGEYVVSDVANWVKSVADA